MRKFILMLALVAMPLAGCAGFTSIPTSPAAVTNMTKADEQLAVGADLAYKGWRLLMETAVETGLVKGQLAARLALVDNDLFEAYLLVDRAYKAANHDSLVAAVTEFNRLHRDAEALIPRKGQ